MRRIVILVLVLGACLLPPAWTQSPTAGPPPELKQLDLWVGDWMLVGTAKDTATEPEYKLHWKMQGRWVLGGHFVQISHTWIGKGVKLTAMEILSYDLLRKIHTCSGFQSDGTTWIMTATFSPGTSIETGTDTYPDGKTATWRNTWSVSADGMSISGKSEREQDGVRWTNFTVKGTRTKPPSAIQ